MAKKPSFHTNSHGKLRIRGKRHLNRMLVSSRDLARFDMGQVVLFFADTQITAIDLFLYLIFGIGV